MYPSEVKIRYAVSLINYSIFKKLQNIPFNLLGKLKKKI